MALPAERAAPHIGLLNEGGLHAAVKQWLAQPGDRLEAHVDGYVVDIVRDDLLIEVQTGGFADIRAKLRALLAEHPLRLVYPVAQEKWIVQLSPETGEEISRRRSPKRGRLTDLFDELAYIPELVAHHHLELEVLLTREEERRCRDGRGSWRRGGVSIVGRELLAVLAVERLRGPADLARLLPQHLPQPFTNRALARHLGIRLRQAQRFTYCLRQWGLLAVVGRKGRAPTYATTPP
jgi:hypothetical protein